MRAISSRTRMDQTCFGWSGFFWPTSNPLFQGRERSLTGRAGIAVPPPHRPSASLCCERIIIATHELCSHSNEHRDRPLLALSGLFRKRQRLLTDRSAREGCRPSLAVSCDEPADSAIERRRTYSGRNCSVSLAAAEVWQRRRREAFLVR